MWPCNWLVEERGRKYCGRRRPVWEEEEEEEERHKTLQQQQKLYLVIYYTLKYLFRASNDYTLANDIQLF